MGGAVAGGLITITAEQHLQKILEFIGVTHGLQARCPQKAARHVGFFKQQETKCRSIFAGTREA